MKAFLWLFIIAAFFDSPARGAGDLPAFTLKGSWGMAAPSFQQGGVLGALTGSTVSTSATDLEVRTRFGKKRKWGFGFEWARTPIVVQEYDQAGNLLRSVPESFPQFHLRAEYSFLRFGLTRRSVPVFYDDSAGTLHHTLMNTYSVSLGFSGDEIQLGSRSQSGWNLSIRTEAEYLLGASETGGGILTKSSGWGANFQTQIRKRLNQRGTPRLTLGIEQSLQFQEIQTEGRYSGRAGSSSGSVNTQMKGFSFGILLEIGL